MTGGKRKVWTSPSTAKEVNDKLIIFADESQPDLIISNEFAGGCGGNVSRPVGYGQSTCYVQNSTVLDGECEGPCWPRLAARALKKRRSTAHINALKCMLYGSKNRLPRARQLKRAELEDGIYGGVYGNGVLEGLHIEGNQSEMACHSVPDRSCGVRFVQDVVTLPLITPSFPTYRSARLPV